MRAEINRLGSAGRSVLEYRPAQENGPNEMSSDRMNSAKLAVGRSRRDGYGRGRVMNMSTADRSNSAAVIGLLRIRVNPLM